jgi:voltage-gated potassium channel
MRTAATERLYRIVFGTDTRAGKVFDIILLWMIVLSVVVVILESVPQLSQEHRSLFFSLEIFFSILFTIEYILRIIISPDPLRYIRSRLGIIDLLGILPFYMSMFAVGYHYLIVFRFLRMLRVFRILRLFRFVRESDQLFAALRASFYKIAVFISFVLTIVVLLGTLMYVVEGQENGFTSIPESIYWTIVTITTVGYGDITPQTGFGKWIASVIMLCGYAIIAVPTGIVTVELNRRSAAASQTPCPNCGHSNNLGARFCNYCGAALPNSQQQGEGS